MYDTYVTIVGNVLTRPEWRRTKTTGSLVANFKVASTARRLDRETGQWVDGNSLRVRVNCWRRLAESVGNSLMTGDPVIVVGRLYTRDWTDEEGNRRLAYELEAAAVGHDLSRGQGTFERYRPAMSTNVVEDERDGLRVGGEETDPVPPEEVPASVGSRDFQGPEPVTRARLGGPGDELLGPDDDLGSTDDSGEAVGDGEPLGTAGADPAVSVTPFPAATSVGEAAAGAQGPDNGEAAVAHGPGTGDEATRESEPGTSAAGTADGPEERRGRGRRRARTAVPV